MEENNQAEQVARLKVEIKKATEARNTLLDLYKYVEETQDQKEAREREISKLNSDLTSVATEKERWVEEIWKYSQMKQKNAKVEHEKKCKIL